MWEGKEFILSENQVTEVQRICQPSLQDFRGMKGGKDKTRNGTIMK